MPMIDVFAPAGLLPAERVPRLLQALAEALLRHEGAPLRPPYLENTAAYLHELPAASIATGAGTSARALRAQVVTPPSALSREAQRGVVAEITTLLAEAAGDPGLARRTWVTLVEAAEGGWGVAGQALGREEFAAARAAAASGQATTGP